MASDSGGIGSPGIGAKEDAKKKPRRSPGDGGIHWDEKRQRYIASVSVGYNAAGKRTFRRASGKTVTEARTKLKELLRDHVDGLSVGDGTYTVRQAVEDWLRYGLTGRSNETRKTLTFLAETHVIPSLGKRRLRELTAEEVDRWLRLKSESLSTRTLQGIHSCLNRAVKRAMSRDKVKRNVVELCSVPQGKPGRPSKALTVAQASAILAAAEEHRMYPYIVVSLLTGARTEEMRALTWDHVDLTGDEKATPAVPPHIAVWRSVRVGGDTKTKKSRRTLALPARCVEALKVQAIQQTKERARAGERWQESGLVFTSTVGTALDASHVRRDFRAAIKNAEGMNPADWTPRELRHSFVSLLSDSGVPVEQIARLVGHSSTAVTELVYRKQIRPVVQDGAQVMDRLFGGSGSQKPPPGQAGVKASGKPDEDPRR